MIVDELIAALLKQDKNAEVFFNDSRAGHIYAVDEVYDAASDEVILTGEEE